MAPTKVSPLPRIAIRPPIVAASLWVAALAAAGVVTLVMTEGLIAVVIGGGFVQQPWGLVVAGLVALLTLVAVWRVLQLALILDDGGVTVRNVFRGQRVGLADIAAIRLVIDETDDDDIDTGMFWRGQLLAMLLFPANQLGVALDLRNRPQALKARATFRRKVEPAMLRKVNAWASQHGIAFNLPSPVRMADWSSQQRDDSGS